MLTVDDELLQKFGKELIRLREENNVTNRYIERITKIDNSTLLRLESGFIQKINPFMLKKLADFYNINVLNFYILLGYLNAEDVSSFENHTENKNQSSLPLLENFDDLKNKNRNDLKKIKLPLLNNNLKNTFCIFLYKKYHVFVYTPKLKPNNLGIFYLNGKYIFSRYYIKDNLVIINDIYENFKLYVVQKEEVNIIGRIHYSIEKED